MAVGGSFEADEPVDPRSIPPGQSVPTFDNTADLLDAVRGKLNEKKSKNARLILERYVRDFVRSSEKKSLEIEAKVTQLQNRGAPRGSDPQEISQAVDSIVERQVKHLEKLNVQIEKEFDNIETRLKTQKGLESDFDTIIGAREILEEQIEDAINKIRDASGGLKDKGQKALDRKGQKQKLREAKERVQQAGDQAREAFLEDNKSVLEATMSETFMGLFDKIFLMGRRGKFYDDKRKERLDALNAAANKAGEDAANSEAQKLGLDKAEYEPGGPPEGFRSKDLLPMFSKVAGIFTALKIADSVISAGIQRAGNFATQVGTGRSSTGSLTGTITGSGLPLNVGGKVFTEVITVLEEIAKNTERDILGFAPNLLSETINRDIRLMEFNMDRALKLDSTLAGITRSRTDLEIAMLKTGDRLLDRLGPYLIGINNLLTNIMDSTSGIDPKAAIESFLLVLNPSLRGFIDLLWASGASTLKDIYGQGGALEESHLKDVEAFFNNQPFAPNGRMNMNIPKNARPRP